MTQLRFIEGAAERVAVGVASRRLRAALALAAALGVHAVELQLHLVVARRVGGETVEHDVISVVLGVVALSLDVVRVAVGPRCKIIQWFFLC